MGRIVYAFPATGKTFLCKKNKNYIELASENYHWCNKNISEQEKGKYKAINKDWPNNYLDAIIKAKKKYDIVFITHSGSELCKLNNIHYDLVYPAIECKEEYILRMKNRGNNNIFIKNMEENFEKYIHSLEKDEYPDEKIKLNTGEYLENGINKLNRLKISPLLDKFINETNIITIDNSANIYRKKTKQICESNNIEYVLIIFNNKLIESLEKEGVGKEIGRFYSGSDYSKILLIDNFIVSSSFLGGPNASALMEELSYYGIKYFLSVGTACNINSNNKGCMIVNKAIRDEGTSLFYKEPSLYSYTSRYLNELVSNELSLKEIDFYKGTTWTIDAYYRENIERMQKRIAQGATSIDMESSVWCSVAEYLNLHFSQILFFSDTIKNQKWFKDKNNEEIKYNISKL